MNANYDDVYHLSAVDVVEGEDLPLCVDSPRVLRVHVSQSNLRKPFQCDVARASQSFG